MDLPLSASVSLELIWPGMLAFLCSLKNPLPRVGAGHKNVIFILQSSFFLYLSAFEDFDPFSMVNIIFLPSGPTVQCVNITIFRDFLVEMTNEQFFFVISPTQADPAVQVSPSDDRATIVIIDEPDGRVVFSKIS